MGRHDPRGRRSVVAAPAPSPLPVIVPQHVSSPVRPGPAAPSVGGRRTGGRARTRRARARWLRLRHEGFPSYPAAGYVGCHIPRPHPGVPTPHPPETYPPPSTFDHIKPITAGVLHHHAVLELLDRRDPTAAAYFRATLDPLLFDRLFLKPLHLRDPPTGPVRRTTWPARLFRELTAGDIPVAERVPPDFRPDGPVYSCGLKLTPDRKRPELGRVITPVLRLNEDCLPPPRAPIPPLPHLVFAALRTCPDGWLWAGDFKGWFPAWQFPLSVASRYFATSYRGALYGLRRGNLGWTWLPYLMCSLSVAILAEAIDRLPPSCGPRVTVIPWVDNLTGVAPSRATASLTIRAVTTVCSELGAVLHEVETPRRTLDTVGVHLDIGHDRWRLKDDWCNKFVSFASTAIPDDDSPPAFTNVWHLSGGLVWAFHALSVPYVPLRPLFGLVASFAKQVESGAVTMNTPITLTPPVKQAINAGIALVRANPWRSHTVSPPTGPRLVFSDAAWAPSRATIASVVRTSADTWSARALPASPSVHINVLELRAASDGVRRELQSPDAPPPGSYISVLTDSAVAAWWMATDAPRSGPAVDEWRLLRAELVNARVGLEVRLLPTLLQPADLPSRQPRGFAPFDHPGLDDALAADLYAQSRRIARRSAPPLPVLPFD